MAIKNDFTNALQREFDTEVRAHPEPPTLLEAMSVPKSSVQKLKGNFDFRFFELPDSDGTETDVPTEEASAGNIFVAGNTIATKAFSLGNEDFTIDTLYKDGYEFSKKDYNFNDVLKSATSLASKIRKVYQRGKRQFKELQIARQLLFADEWLTGADDITTSAAITADATTFEVANGDKTDLAAGRIVKIGKKIEARSLADALGLTTTDVVLIKTVGADDSSRAGYATITIETDKSLFPTNLRTGRKSFHGMKTKLSAHASGVRVQIDKPIDMTEGNSADQFNKLMGQMAIRTEDENGVLFYVNHDIVTHTRATESALTANDFIGKNLMVNGQLKQVYGANLLKTNNGICRNDGTDDVFYICGFKRGKSFIALDLLMSSAVDRVQRQAGLVDVLTWAQICGAYAHRMGRRNMVMMPVKLT